MKLSEVYDKVGMAIKFKFLHVWLLTARFGRFPQSYFIRKSHKYMLLINIFMCLIN